MSSPNAFLSRRVAQFSLLTIVALSAAYARAAMSPLQEGLRAGLRLDDTQMGLLQGPALAIPFLVVTVPLGLAIDRCSRARLLLVFGLLQLGGSALTALASDFSTLFAARCVIGFTTTAIGTTSLSMLADWWSEAQRGRASMVIVVGQFAGMALAFALGGAFLAVSPETDGWRRAMGWLCLPLFLVLGALALLREPVRTGVVLERPTVRQTWRELWQFRGVVTPITIGIVTAQMSVAAVLAWTAPAMSRAFEMSPDHAGSLIALALVISGIIGPIAGGIVADRAQSHGGPRRTMTALSALSLLTAPMGLFAVADSLRIAAALFTVFLILVTALNVIGTAAFTVMVPNELRGLSMALLASASTLCGDGLAPVVVGALSRHAATFGEPNSIAWALSTVCVVASLAGCALFAAGRGPLVHTSPIRRSL